MYLCAYACVPVCKPTKVFKQLRIKVTDPLGEVCWPIVSIPYYLHWARVLAGPSGIGKRDLPANPWALGWAALTLSMETSRPPPTSFHPSLTGPG